MSSAESNLHELYATSHVAENKVIKILHLCTISDVAENKVIKILHLYTISDTSALWDLCMHTSK
jgi:hypothetical protein